MLSDTRLLTIALTTVPIMLVVAIGDPACNNHRLNDVEETLRAEIKAGDAAILSQMATYQMDIISKIAGLDNRITRLER